MGARLEREAERETLSFIEERIFQSADSWQREYLRGQRDYCSPAAFWNNALRFSLSSQEEVEKAKEFYGEAWNYAGD